MEEREDVPTAVGSAVRGEVEEARLPPKTLFFL
jgi:hypothetical protein